MLGRDGDEVANLGRCSADLDRAVRGVEGVDLDEFQTQPVKQWSARE